jgi:hypothetical protein
MNLNQVMLLEANRYQVGNCRSLFLVYFFLLKRTSFSFLLLPKVLLKIQTQARSEKGERNPFYVVSFKKNHQPDSQANLDTLVILCIYGAACERRTW